MIKTPQMLTFISSMFLFMTFILILTRNWKAKSLKYSFPEFKQENTEWPISFLLESKYFKSEIKKLQTLLVNIILLIKNFTKKIRTNREY